MPEAELQAGSCFAGGCRRDLGRYFQEGWDDGFTEQSCGEVVALVIIIEEQELLRVSVNSVQGCLDSLGRVG